MSKRFGPFFPSLTRLLLSLFISDMAKKGAQRVLEENKKRIRVLTAVVAVSIVSFVFFFDQSHQHRRRLSLSLTPPFRSFIPLPPPTSQQAAFFYARFLSPSAPKALGRHFLGFAAAAAVSSLALLALKKHAEPVFDPASGALLDGGGDLSETGGMTSTMHDAIYVCSAALLLGARWDAALLLLFLPVVYGMVKFWSGVLSPWLFTPTAREAKEAAASAGGGSGSSKKGRGVMPRSGGGGARRRAA